MPSIVGTQLTQAILGLIADERLRQIQGEGFTYAHDDIYTHGELTLAAATYLLGASGHQAIRDEALRYWPARWARGWWKPRSQRDDLIRAGALIVAELERMLRRDFVSGAGVSHAKQGELTREVQEIGAAAAESASGRARGSMEGGT